MKYHVGDKFILNSSNGLIIKGLKTYEEHELVLILVEKQTPKKPLPLSDKKYENEIIGGIGMLCPACMHYFRLSKYCPNCGQRIDLTEEGD